MKYNLPTFLSILFMLLVIHCAFADPFVSKEDSIAIAEQLNSIFGNSYSVFQIVNVDRLEGHKKYYYGAIEDPYETLNNSLLFLAHSRLFNDQKKDGILGVYINGQILWHSDKIIRPECITYGQIIATRDLLNDGKVEIISWWSDCTTGVGGRCLWIFSWDGQKGTLINDTDIRGGSEIKTDQYSDFEYVDLEGDGIWEIEAYGHTIVDEGEYQPKIESTPFYYSWNGQLYGEWPNTPEYDPDFFPPRNKIDVQVKVKVTRIESFNLKFYYIIKNKTSSIQKINEILIGRDIESVIPISSRTKWKFTYGKSTIRWKDTNVPPTSFGTKYQISQGETDSSFVIQITGLPSIQNYYARGYNKRRNGIDLQAEFNNIYVNSKIGYTIGPAAFPDTLIELEFLDSLIYYNQISDSLNWITDPAVTDKYNGYFENTKSHLQQNNNSAAIDVLDSVLTDVETDSGVTLTSEAYALIKYNVEYLKKYLGNTIELTR